MHLKGKQLVVYPCKTLWRALSFAPNHNLCIPQQVKSLLLLKEREKLDHLEERLKAIEGGKDYAFANQEELFLQLQNMCKKGHESFKEYAQRWRDLAAQVAPPMTGKEMITK